MNNFEKIKQMSIDEMAISICKAFDMFAGGCDSCPYSDKKDCGYNNHWKQWLQEQSEVKNNVRRFLQSTTGI